MGYSSQRYRPRSNTVQRARTKAQDAAQKKISKLYDDLTHEEIAQARLVLKLNWANADLARKRLKEVPPKCAVMASAKPGSSLETIVAGVFAILGVPYRPQVPIGRYVADFLVGDQLVIEVDGKRWHSKPADRARDKRKDSFLRREGYVVIRLKEEEIKADAFRCVVRHFPKRERLDMDVADLYEVAL